MHTSSEEEPPPEREFDQSTAWERLEAAAAEAITDLPEFPGFFERTMLQLECSHTGTVNEEYINLELSYRFSAEVSNQDLVREEYRTALRDKWAAAGYDIHRDVQQGDDPPFYALEALQPDGINLWYEVAGYVVLHVQSGCIKTVEGGDYNPDCPTPLGGVTRENDHASKFCSNIDTVYPGEEIASEAVDPFATPSGESSSTPARMVPWAREPDPRETGPTSYEGLL
ncbi:hypothetical protein [Glycomyces tritici]|uniref:Uncharacterized protein n=1 Tax=Glycomyces tritici TaxID=2665176 RepID=A0ABT7YTZ1_9ACTN|nr:hypothetical protein [Glycomyces tritici]MDN3242055.1 hypothetical protein [Glycomyces tritici]